MSRNFTAMTMGCLLSLAWAVTGLGADLKPRIFVLTDIAPTNIEPDDMESMCRLLVHADLFQIEGLVSTTGWSDGGGQEHLDLIRTAIDAYEKDLPNLSKRSNQEGFLADESQQKIGYWPSPDYLRARGMLGSTKRGYRFIGKDNNSAGSDLLIKAADAKDDRPIWVGVWGGANTMAQAIWKVQQERKPEELKAFLHKLRIYTITDQDRGQGNAPYDGSSHYWMRKEFEKDLFFIWDESAWQFQNSTGRANWEKYVQQIQGHGAIGELYPKYKYGVEGDTPSYLYVWPNGLNDPEHPTYGGWGGFFEWGVTPDKTTNAFTNQTGTKANPIAKKYETRFYPAIFNNFAARMAWAKEGKGNRNPEVVVNGDSSLLSVNRMTFAPGTVVTLDASASKDPDGDKLTFTWWVMTEAGTYTQDVKIEGQDTPKARVTVPADAAGKTFHVICEVTDSGTPALTSYRRIIFAPPAKD